MPYVRACVHLRSPRRNEIINLCLPDPPNDNVIAPFVGPPLCYLAENRTKGELGRDCTARNSKRNASNRAFTVRLFRKLKCKCDSTFRSSFVSRFIVIVSCLI